MIAAVPGMRTVEEWVVALLEEGETVAGGLVQPQIPIMRGDVMVGYFEIIPRT